LSNQPRTGPVAIPSVGAFLHLTLLQFYLCYYILHIIVSYTC
jgi:hypothetical protein